MPTCTGHPTITISGKALETRCDPPETVAEALNADGSHAGWFHTSPPTNVSGAFGVRLDPANSAAFPIISPPGFILSLYQATPPGAMVRGNQPAWYWGAAGSVWPHTGYTHTPSADIHLQCRPLSQDLGGGVSGGYLGIHQSNISHTDGFSPNGWAFQDGLPCTLMTASQSAPANPGEYVYYVKAFDLYPVPAYENYDNYDSYGHRIGTQTQFFDRIYVAPADSAFGSSESYILSVRKFLVANLIVITPDGRRGPNPYLGSSGAISASTTVVRSITAASPTFNDPAYTDPLYSSSDIPAHKAFVTRPLYDHGGAGTAPVPVAMNAAAVGDAALTILPTVRANVNFSQDMYHGQVGPVGAAVKIEAVFSDGTAYTLLDGTVLDNAGNVAAQPVDYWMGHSGPAIPTPSAIRLTLTTIDATYSAYGGDVRTYASQVTCTRLLNPGYIIAPFVSPGTSTQYAVTLSNIFNDRSASESQASGLWTYLSTLSAYYLIYISGNIQNPRGEQDHASDSVTGHITQVKSVSGVLQSQQWEGWKDLAGSPSRPSAPVLDATGAPVQGQYPSIVKISGEGRYSVCYQDAGGNVVRQDSFDGLETLN